MKEIKINKSNLEEYEMNEIVRRVKVLLINDKNEILLGYSHNDYQLIGGHVEEGETFDETVQREVMEETGINLEKIENNPFLKISGYYKDWPKLGINRKTEIYYYEIKTNEKPDLSKTLYTQDEIEGNFKLIYIPLSEVKKTLNKNILEYSDKRGIQAEMLKVIDEYKKGVQYNKII